MQKSPICTGVCYRDMVPNLDGQYLFRDYETTLAYIKEAIRNTTKSEAPLYALWILSENVAGLNDLLVQWHLGGEDWSSPSKCHSTRLSTILPELMALFGLAA
jgi:hypothetical protein